MNLKALQRIRKFSRIIIAVLCLFLVINSGFSQSDKNSFGSKIYFEAKVHYGYILPHHNELWVLTNGYFPVLELSLIKQTDGRKPYQYYRKYPQVRLTYLYCDFGRSEQLGRLNAILPDIHLPIVSKKEFTISFGMGLGIAHLSKKFDRINNYQNLAIGSNFNAAVKFEASFQYKLTTQLQINTGLSMLHISNGTIKAPNYGLNLPAIYAGCEWKISRKKIKYFKSEERITKPRKMNVSLMGSMASKQIINVWDKDFAIAAASLTISRFYNNTNKLLLGVDAVYDESTEYLLNQAEKPTDYWLDITKIGVNVGHEWTFSKLSIFMNLGYYVHNNNETNAVLYNKLGLNYDFLKFAFVGINLQTHWAKADFLSIGLGLKF